MANSQLTRQNVSGLLYTRAFAAAYRRYLWINDPDYAHTADPEAWFKVRRDPVIKHAIDRRKMAAAGTEWQIVPASDREVDQRAAELLEALVRQIRRFSQARNNMGEAIFRGSSWHRIEGQWRSWQAPEDDQIRRWWLPTQLRHVDRWRFRVARYDPARATQNLPPNPVDPIHTRWEFFSLAANDWIVLPEKERRWFVRSVFEDLEETFGYGRGLLQSIYFFWRAKEVVLTQGLAGVERWAQGLLSVGIDGARPGDTDRTNDEVADEWIEQLSKHRSEHVIVHDKRDEIQVHAASGTGHQMVKDFLTYLDESITQLILFSVLPTGGGEGTGSLARARVEQESAESSFQADRGSNEEDLQCSLIELVWQLNERTIRQVLLEEGHTEDPRCGQIQLMAPKIFDPQEQIQVIVQALQAGIPLRRDEVYERLGFTMPDDDDDVLSGQDPSAMGGAGGLEGLGGFGDELGLTDGLGAGDRRNGAAA